MDQPDKPPMPPKRVSPPNRKGVSAAQATIIAAVIALLSSILTTYINRTPAAIELPKNPQVVELPVQPNAPGEPQDWIQDGLLPKVAYQAETDGFVSVFTYGRNPARGVTISTGLKSNELRTRSRLRELDGTVVPVLKGQYWLVQPDTDGDLKIQWLPISR